MDLKDKISTVPPKAGVYLFKDDLGRVIYVGKAVNLRNRLRSYFQNPGAETNPRVLWLRNSIADFDYITVNSAIEALLLEANLIKRHRPFFNVQMKDDKRYPFIEITIYEDYPRMRVVRKPENKKSRYFGPYAKAGAMRAVFKLVQQAFGLRTCKYDITKPLPRPCLDFHIGLCPAPCVRKISLEEYRSLARQASHFLDGHPGELLNSLREELERYSEIMEFEKCAVLRDLILSVEHVMGKQQVVTKLGEDMDFIGMGRDKNRAVISVLEVRDGKLLNQQKKILEIPIDENESQLISHFILHHYREGFFIPPLIFTPIAPESLEELEEWLSQIRKKQVKIKIPERGKKKEILEMAINNANAHLQTLNKLMIQNMERHREELEHIRQMLSLNDIPHRIEGFDVSNIGGKMATASMVVFHNGEPLTDHYRRFRITCADQPDDFAMIKEALVRRFRNLKLGEMESFREAPDLVLIDGGKGQLSSALEAAQEEEITGIPIISIAKREEEIFVPGRSEPLAVGKDTPGVQLLLRVRDEAHRFAVSYHRKLRAKKMEISILDGIPGVAKKRKEILLQNFNSIEDIKNATLYELEQLPGFNRKVAESILRYLGSAQPQET